MARPICVVPSSSKWPCVLRLASLLVPFNIVLSFVVLVLASVYVSQALQAKVDPNNAPYIHAKKPTLSVVAAYSLILPVIGFVHTITDFSFFFIGILNPIYALVGAILFTAAWIGQGFLWISCEDSLNDGTADYCFQLGLEFGPEVTHFGHLKGVSAPTSVARQVFAVVMATNYFIIIGFAVAAIYKTSMARKPAFAELKEAESKSPSSSIA
ncbi:MAG: hypothetical protein M1814_000311 [Vezdaea aestivalis]|nr:MAG: hypothetical protein M1814_000311 [Vezdaea aestivalis]